MALTGELAHLFQTYESRCHILSPLSVNQRLSDPLTRVWVMTDAGRKTTAYLKRDGEWFLFSRKIATDNPKVVNWEDL